MILKIRGAGDPVLRTPARLLAPEEIRSPRIRNLIDDMRETMRDAPGVGLAAPQVGVGLQLAVLEDREEYIRDLDRKDIKARERKPVPFQVIINPSLALQSDPDQDFYEGCLSLAGYTARVLRARKVMVECLDENGRPRTIHASGWYARILQHEIDHLQGMLYIDRMRSTTFTSLENFRRYKPE